MVYGTVSRGYKAGSFNTLLLADPFFGSPYKPEFAWSYELGSKVQLFNRRAYVNLAAFYEKFSDLQETASVGGASFAVQNAAKAKVTGLEWEIGVRPVRGLNPYTSGAYTDDKYLELDPTTSAAKAHATVLPMISHWQYQIGGSYELELGGRGSLLLAADYDYRSPFFVQVSLDPISRIGSNRRLNGSITYKAPGDHVEVYVQGSNITKSHDWADSLNFLSGFFGLRYPAQPRIVRVGLRYKY
jgi:iron complex outermembrane receptor protein